jgi:tRNA nucleotidyltransferase (CCA-adding enzyme)
MKQLMMKLPEILKTISKRLKEEHAKAIVVGGSVRDHFLKLPSKDYDIEVYGLESLEVLEKILSEFGSVNLVGKSFGVLKFVHNKEEYDFSFPRTEAKVAQGHKGFEVQTDGKMDFKTASKRRDFTINAMGYDIEEKTFLDPFDAQEDIKNKILRHIDDDSFVEDPLRVYRVVQFSARFEFELADETKVLCKEMITKGMLEELPKERVYGEWKKLLLKAEKPSLGFIMRMRNRMTG